MQAERKVQIFIIKDHVNGNPHYSFALEKIVVQAETIYTMLFCQFDLPFYDIFNPRVIKSKFARKTGLKMFPEKRPGFGHICPFRESLSRSEERRVGKECRSR